MRLPVFFRFALSLLPVLASFTAAGREETRAKPLSDLFPADTVLFIECPNVPALIEASKGTGLWALWQDDSMRSIRLSVELPETAEDSTDGFAVMREFVDLAHAVTGGAALGLCIGEEGFEYLFTARMGENVEAAETFLDSIYAAETKEGMPPAKMDVNGVAVNVSGVDGEYTAVADGLLFVGSKYAVLGALDRRGAASNAGSLTASVNYAKAASFFSRGPCAYRGYLDFPTLLTHLKGSLADAAPFDVSSLMQMIGVDDVETVSMEGVFALSGILDHIYISTRTADARLLDMAGREPFQERRLCAVPREAIFFGGRTSDVKGSYRDTLGIFRMASGATGFDADAIIEKFEQGAGVNFERDIIDSLGDESIGYFEKSGPFSMMALVTGVGVSQVTLMEVEDEDTLKEAIAKVVAYAEADPDVLLPLTPPTHRPARIETTLLGDQKVYSLVPPGGQFVAPSLTVANGYLIYANSKQGVRAAVDRLIAPAASITDSSDYSRARSVLDREAAQLAYVNLDRIFEILYEEALPNFASDIDDAYNRGEIPFNSGDIPPAFRVKKHLDGASMAVITGGNLIDMQLYTPCGTVGFLAPALIAMAAKGAPGIAPTPPGVAAGETTSAERERLLKIGGLLQLATTERHGRFPDDLADVVPPAMLQAPQDPEPDTPVDYLYIAGLTTYSPGRTILVYEREGLQGDGRHVLYVDGSVEFLTEEEFRDALDRAVSLRQETAGEEAAGEEDADGEEK